MNLDEQMAGLLRRLAADRGASYADVVRSAVKLAVQLEVERALRSSRAGTARACVVCEQPRRADTMSDAMAHMQCDQIVANLERSTADA